MPTPKLATVENIKVPPHSIEGEQAVLGGLSASDKAPIEGVTMGDPGDGSSTGTVREARNPLKIKRWREVPL